MDESGSPGSPKWKGTNKTFFEAFPDTGLAFRGSTKAVKTRPPRSQQFAADCAGVIERFGRRGVYLFCGYEVG